MTAAIVAGTKNTATCAAASSVSVSTAAATTSGNLLVACISWLDVNLSAAAAVATPSGWTEAIRPTGGYTSSYSAAGAAIFYKAATGGVDSCTVNAPSGGAGMYALLSIQEFSGLDASPLDQVGSNLINGVGTTTTGTVTAAGALAQAGELVVVAMSLSSYNGLNPAGITHPPSGYTGIRLLDDTQTSVGAEQAYKIITDTSAPSATWTWNSESTNRVEQGVIATFKEATGGGGGSAATEARVNPRRNRPGRGPYSAGRYYRVSPWQFAYTLPSGGAVYSVDVAEALSAADSLSSAATLAATLAESASATDSLSALAVFLRSVAETASATDSLTTTATFPRSISEAASAADQVSSGAATYSADVAETVTAANTVAAQLQAGVTLTEAASATDVYSTIATLLAALAETVTATDSYTSALNSSTYNLSLAETVSAVDSIAAQLAAAMALAETGSATDTIAAQAAFQRALAETVAALDAVSAGGITNVTITETAAAADQVSAPTGFGDVPTDRTIIIQKDDRTITIRLASRTIKIH